MQACKACDGGEMGFIPGWSGFGIIKNTCRQCGGTGEVDENKNKSANAHLATAALGSVAAVYAVYKGVCEVDALANKAGRLHTGDHGSCTGDGSVADPSYQKNENGLDQARNSPNFIFIAGDTMFIAGTNRAQDVWDDVTKITLGNVADTERYRQANKLMSGQIKHVVGHSLGGAVAYRLVLEYSWLTATTYGAPLVTFGKHPRVRSIRRTRDIISIFDRAAEATPGDYFGPGSNHSYHGY